jgi:hypothetical protein
MNSPRPARRVLLLPAVIVGVPGSFADLFGLLQPLIRAVALILRGSRRHPNGGDLDLTR